MWPGNEAAYVLASRGVWPGNEATYVLASRGVWPGNKAPYVHVIYSVVKVFLRTTAPSDYFTGSSDCTSEAVQEMLWDSTLSTNQLLSTS